MDETGWYFTFLKELFESGKNLMDESNDIYFFEGIVRIELGKIGADKAGRIFLPAGRQERNPATVHGGSKPLLLMP